MNQECGVAVVVVATQIKLLDANCKNSERL